jgi:Carboxypeptidase regulatory-like domain
MMRCRLSGFFSLLLLVAGICTATPVVLNKDVEAGRTALAALALAKRMQSPAGVDISQIERAEALLAHSARLQTLAESERVAVSVGILDQLDRASESLHAALAVSQAAVGMPRGGVALVTGGVNGTVTDLVTGNFLSGVRVSATDFTKQLSPSGAGIVSSVLTDAAGHYNLLLPAGKYHIRTQNAQSIAPAPGFVNQAYSGVDCGDALYCTHYVGLIVRVDEGSAVGNIDFALARAGGVSGIVRSAADNSLLSGVTVRAVSEDGGAVGTAVTSGEAGSEGTYQIEGLPTGQYRVYAIFDPSTGLQPVAFNGWTCGFEISYYFDGDCNYIPVDLIPVAASSVFANINISAPALSSLSGTIVDDLLTPIAGAFVYLIAEDGWTYSAAMPAVGHSNGESTGVSGVYTFPQVRPGNYRLFVNAPGFLSEVYPNVRCVDPVSCDAMAVGGRITVVGMTTRTGVDVSLSRGASLSGTVTRVVDGTPVVGVVVSAGNAALGEVGSALTDSNGTYTIRGLPDAVLHVWTVGSGNVTDTALGNGICPGAELGACLDRGPGVSSSSSAPASGINIAMAAAGTVTGTIGDVLTGNQAPMNTMRATFFAVAAPGQPQPLDYTFVAVQSTLGGYVATGLAPGAYKVVFESDSVSGWVDSALGGAPCARGGCDHSFLPTVVVAAAATTTGVDAMLPRAAVIRGSLTIASSGAPLHARVFDPAVGSRNSLAFYRDVQNYAGIGKLDRAGNYLTRSGFLPGPLFASTFLPHDRAPFGGNYVDQLFNGIDCPWLSCGGTTGGALALTAVDLGGVNFALPIGGTLSGVVTRSSDALPLEHVVVEGFNDRGYKVGQARTNALGGYTLYGLPTGTYFVSTRNQIGYVDRAYSTLSCEPFCNPLNGVAVSVVAPMPTNAINFELTRSVSVVGTVSNAGAVGNIAVEIYGAIGNFLFATTTNNSGGYAFEGMDAGRFYVRTRNALGRIDGLYNGAPCVGAACQVRNGTPIDLGAGMSATAIDLALSVPGSISGRITDQTSNNALSGVSLQLLDPRGVVALSTRTDFNGSYQFNGLAAGNYFVVTRNTPTYVDEAFGNKPCSTNCAGLNGTTITVSVGANQLADFQLTRGATINGSVRSNSNAALVGAVVQIHDAAGDLVQRVATDASGNYRSDALTDGIFYLRSHNDQGFVDEVHSDRTCSGYCDVLNGNPVIIASAVTPAAVDFVLAPGGSIAGRVSSSAGGAGGAGIPLATVTVFDIHGVLAASTMTSANGNYLLSGLKPGNYRLRTFNSAAYVDQIHSGQSCSPRPCLLAIGTEVNVSALASAAIDFSLAPGGVISGTATDVFHNPLKTGNATLYDTRGSVVVTVAVSEGRWEFKGLADGTYYVLIENNDGLIDELYANVSCPAGACDITELGTPIVLSTPANNVIANIDLTLNNGQTISGNIKDVASNVPIKEVTVYIFDAVGIRVGDGSSNALGNFTSSGGFVPGTYYAATADGVTRGAGNGYVNQRFAGGNCLLSCDTQAGTPIVIASDPVTGINFALNQGVGFSGSVVDGNAQPLALVTVLAVDSTGRAAGRFTTDSLGQYTATGLIAGTYFARTFNDYGLPDQLYAGSPCAGSCFVIGGTPIVIDSVNQPADIDFILSVQALIFSSSFE